MPMLLMNKLRLTGVKINRLKLPSKLVAEPEFNLSKSKPFTYTTSEGKYKQSLPFGQKV